MSGFDFYGADSWGVLPSAYAAPALLTTLRFSSHGYTSGHADAVADQHYDSRLTGDLTFEQEAGIGGGAAARARLGYGSLDLWNGDGYFDAILRSYTVDGRDVALKVGPDGPYAGFATAFAGVMARWTGDGDNVRVELRDRLHQLEAPLQANLYAGSGGLEGGDALAGKPKPLCFGKVFNVPAVFVGNVDLGDGALATYQVHDGQTYDVPAVRERGAPMTRVGVAPAGGEYRVHAAQGVFQLGFTPAGLITADVWGDASPTFVSDTARIARRILTARFGLASAALDAASFDGISYAVPGDVGIWFPPQPLFVLEALGRLMDGVSGFVTASRAGLYRLGRIDAPLTVPAFRLGEAEVISLTAVALPDEVWPPNRRRRLGCRRNYAPSGDLAGSLSADDRAALANEYRIVTAFSDSVAANYALPTEPPPVPGLFWDTADGQAEVERLLDLWSGAVQAYEVVTDRYLGRIELGHTGFITWPADGFAAGRFVVVARWKEDFVNDLVTMTVLAFQ